MSKLIVTAFTKPWTNPLSEVAAQLTSLGFDGVELTVRPGYQVSPEDAVTSLPKAVQLLDRHGLVTPSIAADPTESIIAACGEAGVRTIRICAPIDMNIGYRRSIEGHRRRLDALLPSLERHDVAIGVQNHSGYYVGSAVGLVDLLQPYDPRRVCAVLDMAHCAIDGEPVRMAVDIVEPFLNGLVNFKSAHTRRSNPREQIAEYGVHWATHQHSGYRWSDLVAEMKRIGFSGTFCMPAEYSDPDTHQPLTGKDVIPFLAQDLSHLKSLIKDF